MVRLYQASDSRPGSLTMRWMASIAGAESAVATICEPATPCGMSASLRVRHSAQSPSAARASCAIARTLLASPPDAAGAQRASQARGSGRRSVPGLHQHTIVWSKDHAGRPRPRPSTGRGRVKCRWHRHRRPFNPRFREPLFVWTLAPPGEAVATRRRAWLHRTGIIMAPLCRKAPPKSLCGSMASILRRRSVPGFARH